MNGAVSKRKTISSLEIAKLTSKEHKDVTRDITKMLDELGKDLLKYEHISKDPSKSKGQKSYVISKRECLILVSAYGTRMRAAIIDRWQELEEKPITLVEQFAVQCQLALDAERAICKAQATVKEAEAEMAKINAMIKEKAKQEIHPKEGYYSIGVCLDKLEKVFPKSHTKGILHTPNVIDSIGILRCIEYVEATNSMRHYPAYKLADLEAIITVSMTQDVKTDDTQKTENPWHDQPF